MVNMPLRLNPIWIEVQLYDWLIKLIWTSFFIIIKLNLKQNVFKPSKLYFPNNFFSDNSKSGLSLFMRADEWEASLEVQKRGSSHRRLNWTILLRVNSSNLVRILVTQVLQLESLYKLQLVCLCMMAVVKTQVISHNSGDLPLPVPNLPSASAVPPPEQTNAPSVLNLPRFLSNWVRPELKSFVLTNKEKATTAPFSMTWRRDLKIKTAWSTI